MLGTVLDRITSLIGRAFVITGFFPVLVFTALNIGTLILLEGIAGVLARWQQVQWDQLKELQVPALIGFFLLTVALAYLLIIVNPVLKRLLEGDFSLWLPGNLMRNHQRRRFNRLRQHVHQAASLLNQMNERCEYWKSQLIQANQAWRTDPRPPILTDRIGEAEKAVRGLQSYRELDQMERMLNDLEAASKLVYDLFCWHYPLARLEALQEKLLDLWKDAQQAAEVGYSSQLEDLQSKFAYQQGVAGIHRTTLGNILASTWEYPYTRYGINAPLMWPRLQNVIPENYYKVVEDARISYDFSIIMTYLSMIYTVQWALLLIVRRQFAGWFWLPLLGLLASILFYSAAIEAGRSFGSVFRACFDLFRFKLLDDLHLDPPADIAKERELWDTLNQVLIFSDTQAVITYTKASPPPPTPPKNGSHKGVVSSAADKVKEILT